MGLQDVHGPSHKTAPLPTRRIDENAPEELPVGDVAGLWNLDDDHLELSPKELSNGEDPEQKLNRILEATKDMDWTGEDLGALVENFVDPPSKAPAQPPASSQSPILADALRRVEDAYENCTKNGWSLESRLKYLEAARSAVAAYEKEAPADPNLKTLRQLDRDITRDVKGLEAAKELDSLISWIKKAIDSIYDNSTRTDLMPGMLGDRKLKAYGAAVKELEAANAAMTEPLNCQLVGPSPQNLIERAGIAFSALEGAENRLIAEFPKTRPPFEDAIWLPGGLLEHIAKAKLAAKEAQDHQQPASR